MLKSTSLYCYCVSINKYDSIRDTHETNGKISTHYTNKQLRYLSFTYKNCSGAVGTFTRNKSGKFSDFFGRPVFIKRSPKRNFIVIFFFFLRNYYLICRNCSWMEQFAIGQFPRHVVNLSSFAVINEANKKGNYGFCGRYNTRGFQCKFLNSIP